MSEVIDTLITEFKLLEAAYVGPSKKVLEATQEIGLAIEETGLKAKEFGATLGERLRVGEILAPLAALGTITGIVDLGKDALATSAKINVLQRSLEGMTGSAGRAKEIMEFGESQAAKTGLFDVEQIDKASIKLEAFGLRAETYLPAITKLGAVFGQGGEGLDVFAEALGKIKEGDATRAMMILSRSSIGTAALKEAGGVFNGRQLVGTPDQQLDVILRAINSSSVARAYGAQIESDEAKTARLGIAWEAAMVKGGTALRGFLVQPFTQLTDGLNEVVESGQVDRIVSGFAGLFNLQGGDFKSVVHSIADFLEKAPSQIRAFENEVMPLFLWLKDNLNTIADIWAGIWIAGKLNAAYDGVTQITGALWGMVTAIKAAQTEEATLNAIRAAGKVAAAAESGAGASAAGAGGAGAAAAAGLGGLASVAGIAALIPIAGMAGSWIGDKIGDGLDAVKAKIGNTAVAAGLDAAIKNLPGGIGQLFPYTFSNAGSGPVQKLLPTKYEPAIAAEGDTLDEALKRSKVENGEYNAQLRYLEEIAKNTKETTIDFKRFAFGGGDLGGLGVTTGEIQGLNRGSGGGVSHRAAAALHEALTNVMQEMVLAQ